MDETVVDRRFYVCVVFTSILTHLRNLYLERQVRLMASIGKTFVIKSLFPRHPENKQTDCDDFTIFRISENIT